ncbi:hypothetical protein Syun_026399 [Stephania yunnanensis]|uniref:Uncharacterized protein n=1 Tax=Stephania yunnanensis TaxID=152371 RepID=A0AAP0F2C4_9MAGN
MSKFVTVVTLNRCLVERASSAPTSTSIGSSASSSNIESLIFFFMTFLLEFLLMNGQRALQLIYRHALCVFGLLDRHNHIREFVGQSSKYLLNDLRIWHVFPVASHLVGNCHHPSEIIINVLIILHGENLKVSS